MITKHSFGSGSPAQVLGQVQGNWNGTKWAQVAGPSPGSGSSLYAVAASSASNIWAVGQLIDNIHKAFAVHCC